MLAHQDLRQVSKDPDVLSAVLSNPYTRVCFRVGDADARRLEEGFTFFDAKDLQNLGLGQAICRVERADYDFNLRTLPLPAVELALARARRERIIAGSRERYATPRAHVEALVGEDGHVQPPPERPERSRERRPEPRPVPTVVQAPEAVLESVAPSLPGRGGPQHKYLQSLVGRLAEERGFRVTIEKTVLGGHGHIDVALQRGDCSVACEICVTTRAAHEVQNLNKCLAAGFDYAVLVCSNEQTLNTARSALVGADPERLRFVLPDRMIPLLDELATPAELPDDAETPVARGAGDRPPKDVSVSPEAKKRLLTAKDAASYIGLAQQTLAKMRVTGDSPPFYKVGRCGFSKLCHLFSLNSVTPRAVTPSSPAALGSPPP